MGHVLSIRDIRKDYGRITALKGVSFEVPEGAVFGVLGPNGSGKTTLLGILLDVLQANQGSFEWFGGMANPAARKQIGALLETPNFYHYLSATDNLKINAAIKGRGADDIDRVLELVKLSHRKHSPFSTYSLGMKQRLAIANALLGHPKVLVLDEPTNGLDPEGIAEIRELILELKQQGLTIIIASHLLDEIEKVCTHVAVLKLGTLLASGQVEDVFRNEDLLEISATDLTQLQQVISAMPGVIQVINGVHALKLVLDPSVQAADVNRYCFEKGILLNRIYLKKKSLETQFMELTRN